MDKIMYRLVYNRRKCLNKAGTALVQIEAYLNGRKKYFSTKIFLKPNQWNVKKHQVVRHSNASELNYMLHDMLTKIEQAELDLWKKDRLVSLDALKEAVEQKVNKGDFLSFMQKEINNSLLKASTKRNHFTTYDLLSQFRKVISFQDLNYEFLTTFENFLNIRHYHVNTIAKHMKHLKRYVNIAISKGFIEIQHNAFRKYKIKVIENRNSFLIPEELERLENLSLTGRHSKMQKSLDAFLFCCYVGLRYSDFTDLCENNFYSLNGETWLSYQSIKTGIKVRVPLNHIFDGKPLKLLEKYHSNLKQFFTLKDNSNVNKELNRIAQIAQLEKHISFHTARHTNASLLIYKGVNITTVQKLLGHKNVKTTQIYTHVMDMTIINDLERCKDDAAYLHRKLPQ